MTPFIEAFNFSVVFSMMIRSSSLSFSGGTNSCLLIPTCSKNWRGRYPGLIAPRGLLGQKLDIFLPRPEEDKPLRLRVRILWTCAVGDGLFENGGTFLEVVEDRLKEKVLSAPEEE